MTSFLQPDRVERCSGRHCPRCGHTEHLVLIRDEGWTGGHHGRVECAACQAFIKWAPKPDSAKKRRPSQSRKLVAQYSQGFCEICLRHELQIPAPQTLEAHHIIPVEKGGGDEQANIQICCTACHKLIHWQRTYLGHTLNEEEAS